MNIPNHHILTSSLGRSLVVILVFALERKHVASKARRFESASLRERFSLRDFFRILTENSLREVKATVL